MNYEKAFINILGNNGLIFPKSISIMQHVPHTQNSKHVT